MIIKMGGEVLVENNTVFYEEVNNALSNLKDVQLNNVKTAPMHVDLGQCITNAVTLPMIKRGQLLEGTLIDVSQ